jgi:hypothetical protein
LKCLNCKKKITSKHAKKFCSQSCSATYNNTHRAHYYDQVCPNCETEFTITGHEKGHKKFCCRECYLKFKNDEYFKIWNTRTLEEVKKMSSFQTGQWAYVHHNAKILIKKEKRAKICQSCGYDTHTEICHIKPIKEFEKTATLAEVNALDNLVILCRNCHWEFDHGLLELEEQ